MNTQAGMKMNKETNILTERAVDDERLRAVLRDWGYSENDIHRVLQDQRVVDQKLDRGFLRSDQSTAEVTY